jgi:hypothetical protein
MPDEPLELLDDPETDSDTGSMVFPDGFAVHGIILHCFCSLFFLHINASP